jgi:endonuclease III
MVGNIGVKQQYFIKIFEKAEKHYGSSTKRLAADGWEKDWQMLIATMMSAQTRDETTIPVAENLFSRYSTLEKLSKSKYDDILKIIRRVNFSPRKAKYIIETANILVKNHASKVPSDIDVLVTFPGVGRKTANLFISEVHNMDGICVDTHVHRISNVFGFVKTNTPEQTEMALRKLVPQKYWSRINRVFVLWGQEVRGKDKKKFLERLND